MPSWEAATSSPPEPIPLREIWSPDHGSTPLLTDGVSYRRSGNQRHVHGIVGNRSDRQKRCGVIDLLTVASCNSLPTALYTSPKLRDGQKECMGKSHQGNNKSPARASKPDMDGVKPKKPTNDHLNLGGSWSTQRSPRYRQSCPPGSPFVPCRRPGTKIAITMRRRVLHGTGF
jgi:hypothetical protein